MARSGDKSRVDADEVGRIFRAGSGRAVAALIRIFGDIDVAEDAVQDAFATALERWPSEGLPANPDAWITATGRNRAIDRLRRESLGRALLSDVVRERGEQQAGSARIATDGDLLDDDPLRLIFTCCHPALSPEAQVALTLRLLCGLATLDVARAFLVEEATMGQRILRAKRKIKSAHIPYRVPSEAELQARLPPVLGVCYLVYNAGAGRAPIARGEGGGLCHEGLRLARLMRAAMPEVPELAGLLALMLLCESRRGARFTEGGSLVLLSDQDRNLWDRRLIDEGQDLLRECLARDEPGPYQLQAAIQAVHADAPSAAATDWRQIAALYDELPHLTRTPVVALNRAIAVGELAGPAAALALVEPLELSGYYLFHATRADLLRRLERPAEAAAAYRTAASLAPTEAERELLGERAGAVAGS